MQLDHILLPIQKDLARVEEIIAARSDTNVPTITQVVHHIIQNGGKRIRPALTLLSAKMTGYSGEAAAYVGAAIEMVHTASLLHDDVVDSAPTRRGRSSANAKWGNQISVLVGDFFWCKACQIIVEKGTHKILNGITEAIVGTTEGEVIELVASNDIEMSEDTYLKIIKSKTALLLAVSAEAGAMLSEVSEEHTHSLRRYGFDLGIAFQLADDALDYVSDENRFGKTNGTDLREGHLTLPLIHALRSCNDTERAQVRDALLSKTLSDTQLHCIVELLHKYDGITYTQKLAEQYVEKAKSHLEPFKPTLEKESLLSLADYTITRGE